MVIQIPDFDLEWLQGLGGDDIFWQLVPHPNGSSIE